MQNSISGIGTSFMKEIIRIDSNISNEILRIELFLSNVCNYACWYCFPGFHEGDKRWPEYEQVIDKLGYVIDYYKTILKKKTIHLHIIGGEPTLWKDFGKFVQFFNNQYGCIISVSSNGSRTIRWWEEYGHYVNHVMLSCHHEKVDPSHISSIADMLYTKNITVNAMVLMDPNHWNRCTDIVDRLKHSAYWWPITAVEVHHQTTSYNSTQKKYLQYSIKRYPELNYWFRSEKIPRQNPTVFFNDGTEETVPRNWLSLNKKNYFNGWECNIGVDTLFIDTNGDMRGGCGQPLYNLRYHYNIYDTDFFTKFKPEIIPTICRKDSVCDCQPETTARKQKIIPIISA